MSSKYFSFKGYEIPVGLVGRTGGGPENFEKVSDWHVAQVQKYIGIEPSDSVLEVGCGIGRDAIPLSGLLSEGRYIGTDVIRQSIEWCKENIQARNPNFLFYHHDVRDSLHNPHGELAADEVRLPAENESIDLILLHSVFTHMFPEEVAHYLGEFNRVLRPSGRIWASFFIVNEELRRSIQGTGDPGWGLTFRNQYSPGCYINDVREPRQSVAYEEDLLYSMIEQAGLALDQSALWGNWSGFRARPRNGQDAVVLRRSE